MYVYLVRVNQTFLSRKVELEMDDCRDDKDEWNAICQGLLRASYGMNYIDFLDLISKILRTRRDLLEGRLEAVWFDECNLGVSHCQYDVDRIREVLEKLESDFSKLDMKNKVVECRSLLECGALVFP